MACNPLTTEARHGRQFSHGRKDCLKYQIPEDNVQRFLAVGCLPVNKVARRKIIFRRTAPFPALAPFSIQKITNPCLKSDNLPDKLSLLERAVFLRFLFAMRYSQMYARRVANPQKRAQSKRRSVCLFPSGNGGVVQGCVRCSHGSAADGVACDCTRRKCIDPCAHRHRQNADSFLVVPRSVNAPSRARRDEQRVPHSLCFSAEGFSGGC